MCAVLQGIPQYKQGQVGQHHNTSQHNTTQHIKTRCNTTPQYKQGQAGQHGDDNDYDGFCSVHHSKNLPSSLPVVIITIIVIITLKIHHQTFSGSLKQ